MQAIIVQNQLSGTVLATLSARVHVRKSDAAILSLFAEAISGEDFTGPLPPSIASGRKYLKALGRNPDRYLISSEAIRRRIADGKSLYQINNIVDLNNYLSLRTAHSIGSYDVNKLVGPVVFRKGKKGESYAAIGKPNFLVTELPVLSDNGGPFGSPVSDSERTKITLETAQVLLVFYGFDAGERLNNHLDLAARLLSQFADGVVLNKNIIT